MRICPTCSTEHESDEAATCRTCGQALPAPSPGADQDEELEFRVYEQDTEDREFVGGTCEFDADAEDREAVARLEEDDEALPAESGIDPDFAPIAGSEACVPEPFDEELTPPSGAEIEPEDEPELTASGKIRHLSDEEVKSISGDLYRRESCLTDKEKQELMKKLSDKDQLFAASAPIEPPKRSDRDKASAEDIAAELEAAGPAPKMAGRARGIAYFYRNIIQLKGSQQLFPGDEVTVAGREYELRAKTVTRTPLLIGGGVIFLVILLLVGSLFVSDPGGSGYVAGIVFNEVDGPAAQGTSVVFPDLGRRLSVNAQGMFHSETVPAGSHRIEVVRDGEVVASDFVTVTGDEVSLVALHPEQPGEVVASVPETPVATAKPRVPEEPKPVATVETPPASSASPSPPSAKETKRSSAPKKQAPAALRLLANVDGARLVIDGKVLGAGNLTYERLSPGRYKYEVSRDGYSPATGTVTLAAGETETLSVTLKALPQEQKQQEYVAEDYYLSGLSAVQERDFRAAVTDLNQAVRLDPGYADAWFALGQAQAGLKDWPQSHDAFLRAAEIYRFGKDYSRAITAYNGAMEADDKSIAAYLGRGDLFLMRGDERAAAIDFETAVRLDRRNADAYVGLGRSRMGQGMFDQALKHFKDARSIDAADPVVYQYMMLCYMAEQDYDEVRRNYDKFMEYASDDEMRRLKEDQRYAAALRVVDGTR